MPTLPTAQRITPIQVDNATRMASWMKNFAKVSQELADLQKIPLEYEERLDQRLPFVFEKVRSRLPSSPVARSSAENVAKCRRRKAHFKYREFIFRFPHDFLAFVLAVGPRTCTTFNVLQFTRSYKQRYPRLFSDDIRKTISSSARRQGIHGHPELLEWMSLLFEGSCTMS